MGGWKWSCGFHYLIIPDYGCPKGGSFVSRTFHNPPELWNSPVTRTKGQQPGKCFHLMTSSCTYTATIVHNAMCVTFLHSMHILRDFFAETEANTHCLNNIGNYITRILLELMIGAQQWISQHNRMHTLWEILYHLVLQVDIDWRSLGYVETRWSQFSRRYLIKFIFLYENWCILFNFHWD